MKPRQLIAVTTIAAGLFACQAAPGEPDGPGGGGDTATQSTSSKFELAEVTGTYQRDGVFVATLTAQGAHVATLRITADGAGRMTFERDRLPARDVTLDGAGDVVAANRSFYRAWLMATKQTLAYDPSCGSSGDEYCTSSWCSDGSCYVEAYDCVYPGGYESHRMFTHPGCGN